MKGIHALRYFLPVVIAAGASFSAEAQTRPTLPGTVKDSITGRSFGTLDGIVSDTSLAPLQGAFVSIVGTSIRVGTGPNGRFRITKVPAGEYLVVVKRVGYRPTSAVIDVAAADTARLSYTLEKAVVELNPVTVTERARSVKMNEFFARRRLGIGQFMTAEQIDAINGVTSTDIFRRFTGINVSPDRSKAMPQYYALSARESGNPMSSGACPMSVVLDDVQLPTPFNLDLLPPPRDLAGIEVYSGPSTTPAKYGGFNRGCGVILVWTKDNA
jgi:hypothetical protein